MAARISVGTPYGRADIDVFRCKLKSGYSLCANVYCHDLRDGIPEESKTRKFTIVLPLKALKEEVYAALNNTVGWGWGTIKSAAKSITKKVGVNRLLKVANQVASYAHTYGSAIYPPLGITYNALHKASNLLKAAKAGEKYALQKVGQIKRLAEAGNAAAAKASKALVVLNDISKRVDVDKWIVTIQGWNHQDRHYQSISGTYAAGIL